MRPENDQNMVPPRWSSTVGVNMVLLFATATYKHLGKRPRRPHVGCRHDRALICSLSHVPPGVGRWLCEDWSPGGLLLGGVLVVTLGPLSLISWAQTWSHFWARMRAQFWGPNLVPVFGPTFRFAYRFVLKTAAEVPKKGPRNGAHFYPFFPTVCSVSAPKMSRFSVRLLCPRRQILEG